MELLDILDDCRHVFPLFVRPDVIFVFDELDKIAPDNANERGEPSGAPSVENDSRERKKKVDQLLGALKTFTTHGRARFFFIAGREMLDSFHAERSSTSSLYESLFDRTFEVPSLLSDHSDRNPWRIHSMVEVFVCRQLLDRDVAIYLWLLHRYRDRGGDPDWEKDLRRKLIYSPFCLRTYYHYLRLNPGLKGVEARRIVLSLRNFVQFLTLHSWGNPKRLILLFEHFTKPVHDVDWRARDNVQVIAGGMPEAHLALQFDTVDQQRIILASNLYTQIYHTMGRQLARSSDKLIVSTLVAFQHILKFHRHPFSRNNLERMAETLNIYRPAELNTLIDALLSKVLRPQLRLIRNSHYRYRFDSSFEEEMRYISRVSDIESAAFNFTLDSSESVKAHFREQLGTMANEDSGGDNDNVVGIASLCLIIGDLFSQEQSDGQAFAYYQKAVDTIEQCEADVRARLAHIQVEALLRLGDLYEQRQRYSRAASVYLRARGVVRDLERGSDPVALDVLRGGDSKWDVLRQPFWAYWFLQLKRSPVPDRGTLPITMFEYPFTVTAVGADFVNHYRAGQLAYYYGCHCAAARSFLSALDIGGASTPLTERSAHRRAYAYLNLGENLLVAVMRYGDGFSSAHRRVACMVPIGTCQQLVQQFRQQESAYIESLRAIGSEVDCPAHEGLLAERVDLNATLWMMAHAAEMLAEYGLCYDAALAYTKILAVWGMIGELIAAHRIVSGQAVYMAGMLRSAEWIAEVRERAAANISRMNDGGYSRFLTRWRRRDVASFFQPENDATDVEGDRGSTSPLATRLAKRNKKLEELVGPRRVQNQINEHIFLRDSNMQLREVLNTLFPNRALTVAEQKDSLRAIKEPSFLQRSIPGQDLISFATWEWMTRMRMDEVHALFAVPHNSMSPHSVHRLIFTHWLAGRRYLYWILRDRIFHVRSKKIYDVAAAAIHNFHLASYYARQISINDQDIMFPPPAMILFDLWYLLYTLVEYEVRRTRAGGVDNNSVVRMVADRLSGSKHRRHGTPANCYDFTNTTLRTDSALRDTERLGDISNRARGHSQDAPLSSRRFRGSTFSS